MMKLFCIVCLCGCLSSVFGQMMYQPQNNNGMNAAPGQGQAQGSTQPTAYQPPPQGDAKSLYGNEIPFLNPQDGTVTINGQTLQMGSFRELEARFNKYLAQPEESEEDAKEYNKIFAKLHEILSMKKERLVDKKVMRRAIDLLISASANPLDGGVSDSLCQAVYSAWQAKTNGKAKEDMQRALEREIKSNFQKRSIMESGVGVSTVVSGSGRNKTTSSVNDARSNPRYQYLIKRVAEMEARKKALDGESLMTLTEAKIMYQSTLVHLFAQRRFDHVSIGAALYSRIFEDGDSKLRLDKNSDAAKMFGGTLGTTPTVAILDHLARDLIRDCEKHMKAVNYLVDSRHYVDALERLNEALMIGEMLPPLNVFPFEKRQKLYIFKRDVEKLFELMNGKDYQTALELIAQLKKEAKDLNVGRAESACSAAMFASDAYVSQGQEAMAQRDRDRLELCLHKAIEIWPKNPRLLRLRDNMMQAGNQSHIIDDFVRYVNEKDYRKIYDRQFEFAPLVQSNPDLQRQFTDALSKMAKIERVLNVSREREKLGDVFGAWEELEELKREDPELFAHDRELNSRYADATSKASELIALLQEAQIALERQEHGTALNKFMQAKLLATSHNSRSRFAEQGVERLTKRIL